MEDWFRWILGILNGVYLIVLGWLVNWIATNQRDTRDIDKRLTVMESRPQVDPLAYTKAITEMSGAIATLTAKVAENIQARQDQYYNLMSTVRTLQHQLEAITQDLDLLARQVKVVA